MNLPLMRYPDTPIPLPVRAARAGSALIRRVTAGRAGKVAVIVGPPQSGKSGLLKHLGQQVRESQEMALLAGSLGHRLGADAPPTDEATGLDLSLDLLDIATTLIPGVPAPSALVRLVRDARAAVRTEVKLPGFDDPFAVSRLLRRLAAEKPTVLLLDDLHSDVTGAWLPTLESVAMRLANPDRPLPLAIICTVRTGATADVSHSPTLERLRALGRPRLSIWQIEDLSPSDLRHWLPDLRQPLFGELLSVSGGRRHWARTVYDSWQPEWDSHLSPLPVTNPARPPSARRGLESITEIVAARIDQASTGSGASRSELVDVLCVGALEGATFTADAVALASDREPDEVIDLLDLLVDATAPLLFEVDPFHISGRRPLYRYAFTSALVAEALPYVYLSRRERQELQAALASTLSDLLGRDGEHYSTTIGRLWYQAGRTDLADVVLGETDRRAQLRGLVRHADLIRRARRDITSFEELAPAATTLASAADALLELLAPDVTEALSMRATSIELGRRQGHYGRFEVATGLTWFASYYYQRHRAKRPSPRDPSGVRFPLYPSMYIPCMEAACQLFRELDEPFRLALAQGDLALALRASGPDPPSAEAEALLNEALRFASAHGIRDLEAMFASSWALDDSDALRQEALVDQALEALIASHTEGEDNAYVPLALIYLMRVFWSAREDLQLAIQLGKRAIKIWDERRYAAGVVEARYWLERVQSESVFPAATGLLGSTPTKARMYLTLSDPTVTTRLIKLD